MSLWMRVYFLIFVVYQALALVGTVVWGLVTVRDGYGFASLVGAYVLLIVPAGFGVTLVLSVPVAGLWVVVARVMGWSIVVPGFTGVVVHRCGGCGYDVTGNETGRCPECGISLRAGGEGDDDAGV